VNPRYRLARGIRLRCEAGAEPLLLVPEGIVTLNVSAAAILETLGEGKSVDEVVAALHERFDDSEASLAGDVRETLEDFAAAGFVER
jgi:coenzyme PQQ biosynthesis protein PqqD